jgi:hypothetical protein
VDSDQVQVRPVDDDLEWDTLARSAVGGTVFATSAWLRCAAQAVGGHPLRLGCYQSHGLAAGLCGVTTRRGPLTRLTTPPLTPHAGFLVAPVSGRSPSRLESAWHQSVAALSAGLWRQFDHVQLALGPGLLDARPFAWEHWGVSTRYTYIIPDTRPEPWWERLERRTRTVLRKAQQGGFTVHTSGDLGDLGRLYQRLYEHRHQAAPVPVSLVLDLANLAVASGLAEAHAVVAPDGQVASVVVFVRGWDTLHAWVAGAEPQFNPSGATTLLYWDVVTRAGLPRFDFVGANLPGVAHFKRGFGGDLVPYLVVDRCRHSGIRALLSLATTWRGRGL